MFRLLSFINTFNSVAVFQQLKSVGVKLAYFVHKVKVNREVSESWLFSPFFGGENLVYLTSIGFSPSCDIGTLNNNSVIFLLISALRLQNENR